MLEMNPADKSLPSFREFLAQGQIPIGQGSITTNVTREKVLERLSDYFRGKPREWKTDGQKWIRDKLVINVLWYPVQSVYLTFLNGNLNLIELDVPGEPGSEWDYALEVPKYFRIKKDIVEHLDEESHSDESDFQKMEAIWEFSKLRFFVACDIRTGGCGIGLSSNLQGF